MLTNIERESLTALARTYHSIDRKLDEIANIHATDDLMASAAKVDRINSDLTALRQRAAFLRDKLNASSADAKAEAEYLYENGRTAYPRGFWSYAESNFAPYTCSYCSADATHVGADDDGDFYCGEHKHLAPGSLNDLTGGN